MKLGDTIFNGNAFKNIILNSKSYKRMILGTNLVWSYFGIAINAFRTRILADSGTYEAESILEDRLQEITPNLFDSASLVITPNGVKTSKLYSIKPNDGTGDLSVTRATTATRVNESGVIVDVPANVARIDYSKGSPAILVEPQRTNLLLRSEEFNDVNWTKSELSISSNVTTSPNGTMNADKIIATNVLGHHFFRRGTGLTVGTEATYSIYAKAAENKLIRVGINAGAGTGATFDLLTGAITNMTATSAFAQNIGNGWYRCIVTGGVGSVLDVYLLSNSGLQSYMGNGTDGIFIWGAQLELGTSVTSYIPTTTSSVTRNADVISKTGLSGITSITETFENGTTNVITGNPTNYTMSQGRIKQVIGL